MNIFSFNMKRFISILIFLSLLTGCMERQRSLDNNIISSQNIIVKTAKKYLGKPYRYGAIGP
ncbi:MAG TPA: hypothetical protein ENK76_01370, partial [Campylobacterales bacterium]|nr:hypothetical protein [Campylobacterales bacterium]